MLNNFKGGVLHLAVSPAGDAGLSCAVCDEGSKQSCSSIVGLNARGANLLPPGGDRLRVP